MSILFFEFIYNRLRRKVSNLINLQKYFANKVSKKTVLLIEPNNCHTELFPSFVKYLNELNYEVEIIASYEQKSFLPRLKAKKIYYFTMSAIKKIFLTSKLNEYDFIIFTSYRLYYKNPDKTRLYSKLYDHIKFNKAIKDKTIAVSHHMEDMDDFIKTLRGTVVLSKVLNQDGSLIVVNPCYFKENAPKNKNKKTIFITIGKLENKRKNSNLLYNAVRELLKAGVRDFQVYAVGENTDEAIPSELAEYIVCKGKLGFEDLYKELEVADFYLLLLDFELEEHLRYITKGTSGSFQLIRGFLLPPVIHEAFSKPHGFSMADSIIYNDNANFWEAMRFAINMSNEEYLMFQNNLRESRNIIIKESLDDLRRVLEK